MAKISLQEALDNVEMTYQELNGIAKEIVSEFFAGADSLIDQVKDVNELDNDTIRSFMIKLSLTSYSLSEVKEKSAMKAEIAESLRKEAMARNYVEAAGTSSAKENVAMINTSAETVSEALFNLVAGLFKTKQDELHRVVDVLKSVLMSRNMEAKLTTNTIDN